MEILVRGEEHLSFVDKVSGVIVATFPFKPLGEAERMIAVGVAKKA
jgi:hypothetical protein